MTTPFDAAIDAIRLAGYHNHRLETHSDTVSRGLFQDLLMVCDPVRRDLENGVIKAGHSHVEGYDYVLLVPVYIDNVNEPHLPRPNLLDIDVDAEYRQMLEQMCAAYTARWHM